MRPTGDALGLHAADGCIEHDAHAVGRGVLGERDDDLVGVDASLAGHPQAHDRLVAVLGEGVLDLEALLAIDEARAPVAVAHGGLELVCQLVDVLGILHVEQVAAAIEREAQLVGKLVPHAVAEHAHLGFEGAGSDAARMVDAAIVCLGCPTGDVLRRLDGDDAQVGAGELAADRSAHDAQAHHHDVALGEKTGLLARCDPGGVVASGDVDVRGGHVAHHVAHARDLGHGVREVAELLVAGALA